MRMRREIEQLKNALKSDPVRLSRFAIHGNGTVGDKDWALIARLAENEITDRRNVSATSVPFLLDDNFYIRDYRVLGILGRGGQAMSYLCHDEIHGYVAVKERRLDEVKDWKVIELFDREASVLSDLKHARIPTYFDHFSIDDDEGLRLYVVQEFKFGDDLETVLSKRGPFTYGQIAEFCADLLPTLGYLHDRSNPIIHRDIKPSNIIAHHGFHLIDFGSVQVSGKEHGGSTVTGTYGYAPLEQFMGRAVRASDIYSLGATILELLTGESPDKWTIEQGAVDFTRFNLSESACANLTAMLQPFPDHRPSWDTIAEFDWTSRESRSTAEFSDAFSTMAEVKPTALVPETNLDGCEERLSETGVSYYRSSSTGMRNRILLGIAVLIPAVFTWVTRDFITTFAIFSVLAYLATWLFTHFHGYFDIRDEGVELLLTSSVLEVRWGKYEWKSVRKSGDLIEFETTEGWIQLSVGSDRASRIAEIGNGLKAIENEDGR